MFVVGIPDDERQGFEGFAEDDIGEAVGEQRKLLNQDSKPVLSSEQVREIKIKEGKL